jgi:CheY-like chemotaxis protein
MLHHGASRLVRASPTGKAFTVACETDAVSQLSPQGFREAAMQRHGRCSNIRFSMKAGTLKILAVDDNPSIREAMPFIFAGAHYEVASAPDGYRALAEIDGNPDAYDIIIVDQKMPRMTGLELVQGIKERAIRGKIMVLSAHITPEIRETYEEMGVHVILEKPFDVEKLRSAVDRLAA